jgi:anti-sigma B factor antagonist
MSFDEPTFEVTEEHVGERTLVLSVTGEIHVSTAPRFSARLNDAIAAGHTQLVLDLAGVEFIDSTGLSVLLNALRRVTREGGAMVLACANPTVLRLFEITRLDTTFDILPSREEAIARADQVAAGGSDAGMP